MKESGPIWSKQERFWWVEETPQPFGHRFDSFFSHPPARRVALQANARAGVVFDQPALVGGPLLHPALSLGAVGEGFPDEQPEFAVLSPIGDARYSFEHHKSGIWFGHFAEGALVDSLSWRPIWRDLEGETHFLPADPFISGDYTFQPTRIVDYDTIGAFVLLAYCVEWKAWLDSGETDSGWDGPWWGEFVVEVPESARSADFNGDGVVNTLDFNAYLAAWSDQAKAE